MAKGGQAIEAMDTESQVLTQWLREFLQRVTAQAAVGSSPIGKELELDRFGGSGHHATLRTKRAKLPRALKCAE